MLPAMRNTHSCFRQVVARLLVVAAAAAIALLPGSNRAHERTNSYDLTGEFISGVNLAGAEFGKIHKLDGSRARHGEEYVYPVGRFARNYNPAYFLNKGMKTFRLPFRWERLEPDLGGEFNQYELSRLRETVRDLSRLGAWVILDLHNYARYNDVKLGEGVTNEQFASTWRRLATEFSSNPQVLFGLMNEPYDISNSVWTDAVNSAITAIRSQGARNYVLVAGNGFSASQSWYAPATGGSNASALLAVHDALNRVIFEAHTYLDEDNSGRHAGCVSADIGAERLKPFTTWLRDNNKRGFVGEFGAGRSTVCLEGLSRLVRFIQENRNVYLGWTYWAAGPKWPPDWMYLIEPAGGNDAPQMIAISRYLG